MRVYGSMNSGLSRHGVRLGLSCWSMKCWWRTCSSRWRDVISSSKQCLFHPSFKILKLIQVSIMSPYHGICWSVSRYRHARVFLNAYNIEILYIYTCFFACTFAYYMHMGSCLQNLLSQYRYVYVYIYLYMVAWCAYMYTYIHMFPK